MNNIENSFNRVPSPEEEKGLDIVTDQVFEMLSKTSQYDTRDDVHKAHSEMLMEKRERELIRSVAARLFKKTNRMPDAVDLWSEVKKEMELQKAKVA